MKLALFGGSFDPPHIGHLEIIKKLDRRFDGVVVIPTYLNPFKNTFCAPIQKRFEWLETICEGFKNVVVSDFELQQNRVVYAIEWVEFFAKQSSHLTLVIGADNVGYLPKWRDFKTLEQMVDFLIIGRKGYENNTSYPILEIKNDTISSTQIRDQLLKGEHTKGLITALREQIISTYKGSKI